MRKLGKVKNLIIGIAMLLFTVILLFWPDFGTPMIMMVFGIALFIYGIYSLLYYCRMAIHMVGGKRILYRSILTLDLGVFMLSFYKGSERLILLYLMLLLAASGGIDLVRALQFRKEGAAWKLRALIGVLSILILIIGFIYRKDPHTMVYIFCLGLASTGINRIASVFRKTAVIYIPE